LLLSFSPLVVWVVVFAFGSVFFPPIPATDNFYANSSSYDNGYFATAFVAGLVSFVGSLSAVITSSMARDWAKRFPGQPAWEDLAQGGKVLGIIGLVAVFVVVPCTFFGVAAQNYHGG
jgi:hypothetical protein